MNVVSPGGRTRVKLTDVQSTHSKVFEDVFALSGAFDVHSNFEVAPLGADSEASVPDRDLCVNKVRTHSLQLSLPIHCH